MASNVFNNGAVHACAEKCSTCIFRPGNLMHLESGRLKEMREGAASNGIGGHIVCHQTLYSDQNAICRGWLDSYDGRNDPLMETARSMNVLEEVNPEHKNVT